MITVLLVDDHDLVRAGVKSLLASFDDIKVLADVASGEDAVKFVKENDVDVVVMDVKMPGIGGLEATKKLLRNNPKTKVVALTAIGEEPVPSKLLQAGASGYLTKGSGVDEIVQAVRAVHAGRRYLSTQVAQQLALRHVSDDSASPFDALSERELQIMLMITSGQKVQDISDRLCLSPKTVNSYRYRLFSKLNVQSDVELTHLAIRHGILDTEAAGV